MKQRIVDHSDEILEIAAIVPHLQLMTSLLDQVSGTATPQQLDLSEEETHAALSHITATIYAHGSQ